MGYYRRQDLPFYYTLADAFTLCDNYHCSVLGPTHPNRLMALSGTVDPTGAAGGPVLITNASPDAVGSVHWDTMPEVLEDAGVSWKVYNPVGRASTPPRSSQQHGMLSDAILPYFSQYQNPASTLYQKAFLPQYPNDFLADIASGQLPSVSWLIPPAGYDEHPSSPPALGEWFTSQVLAALVSNPEVWSKTVLFHMYDENDGFFDHVPPPVAPARHARRVRHGARRCRPRRTAWPGRSAWASGCRCWCSRPSAGAATWRPQVFDHTSQLRFLEERFGVRAPNISAWRRRTAGDLTSALHPRTRRPVRAQAAQHVQGPDGQRHGGGLHGGNPSWSRRTASPCRSTRSRRSSRCRARRRPDRNARARAHRRPERDATLGQIEHRGRVAGILRERCGSIWASTPSPRRRPSGSGRASACARVGSGPTSRTPSWRCSTRSTARSSPGAAPGSMWWSTSAITTTTPGRWASCPGGRGRCGHFRPTSSASAARSR